MKIIAFTIFTFFIYSFQLCAQTKNWTVKSGDEIKESLPAGVRFRYPEFVPGSVYFKDGTTSHALLNYSLLTGEMIFVNPDKDTLAIANEATIKLITVNTDSFYYDKVYVELVSGGTSAKLAKKEMIKLGDIKKIGGYGQASSTSAISNLSTVYNGNTVTKLSVNADLQLLKETSYYIGDYYNHFLLATKKNILKMFGKQQPVIEKFLKENQIKFNNQNDLKKLIDFIQKLS